MDEAFDLSPPAHAPDPSTFPGIYGLVGKKDRVEHVGGAGHVGVVKDRGVVEKVEGSLFFMCHRLEKVRHFDLDKTILVEQSDGATARGETTQNQKQKKHF